MVSSALLALALVPSTLAHFQLNFPRSRGFEDARQPEFPCGGFNDVQQERTDFPISGGPILVSLGHQQTNIAVYMAIGDNPGSNFNIVAKQQLMVTGFGDFCFGNVAVPTDLNVTDGTKATIQVVTNAHGSGGLYQCADVTLVDTPLSQSDFSSNCRNGSTSVSQENISGNPNGTSAAEPSGSSSASGSAASPTSAGAGSQVTAASWVLGFVGLAAMAVL